MQIYRNLKKQKRNKERNRFQQKMLVKGARFVDFSLMNRIL